MHPALAIAAPVLRRLGVDVWALVRAAWPLMPWLLLWLMWLWHVHTIDAARLERDTAHLSVATMKAQVERERGIMADAQAQAEYKAQLARQEADYERKQKELERAAIQQDADARIRAMARSTAAKVTAIRNDFESANTACRWPESARRLLDDLGAGRVASRDGRAGLSQAVGVGTPAR